MHPAISIVFFTVTSGLGYGLLFTAVFGYLGGDGSMSFSELKSAVVIAMIAVTAGLLSSVLHLANPKNAWRALSQYRTSWLSREGILAIATYPLVALFLLWAYLASPGYTGVWLPGLAVIGFCAATVYATSMIYACLRTIPAWNNSLTPTNYLLGALMLGMLTFCAVRATTDGPSSAPIAWTLITIAIALVVKLAYFVSYGRNDESGKSDVGTATSLGIGKSAAAVKLLDVGHSAGNFLTKEFAFSLSSSDSTILRGLVIFVGYCLPALLIAVAAQSSHSGYFLLALSLGYGGMLVERWLFFAEAKHVVNLYQSNIQRV